MTVVLLSMIEVMIDRCHWSVHMIESQSAVTASNDDDDDDL